jgi:hypothetical protein
MKPEIPHILPEIIRYLNSAVACLVELVEVSTLMIRQPDCQLV